MRQSYLIALRGLSLTALFFLCGYTTNAQQPTIRDLVLFADTVQFSTSTGITGGSIGTRKIFQTIGNINGSTNIYSDGRVILGNSNTLTGNITAAYKNMTSGYALEIGSNAALTGSGIANGNVYFGGGSISGTITYSGAFTGNIGNKAIQSSNLTLPTLPSLPEVGTFSTGTGTITNNKTVFPDSLNGTVALSGNKTLTFSGVGNYYFKAIKNSGNFNTFVLDFKNATSGVIRIYVEGDVDLYKLNITFPHGGDASRVIMLVGGNGSTSVDKAAWSISNGASGNNKSVWQGTVLAPNGNINIGKGSSEAKVIGAMWSGKKIFIQSGVSITYMPLVNDNPISPFNDAPFGGKVYTPIGSELTTLLTGVSDEAKKVLVIKDGYVLVEVVVFKGKRDSAWTFLKQQGIKDTISNGVNNLIITGMYPIANLDTLNKKVTIINFVRPVFTPIGSSGLIQNAGDTAIRTNFVRGGYNLEGDSTKVGVLSDSYNTLKTSTNNPAVNDVGSGDLPGVGNTNYPDTVQVIQDYPFFPRSDEGRAMLQIIHDVAPKAKLAFRTGFISPGDFAIGIKQLQEAGCNVIVDDITYITESFLRDGAVAKMVDSVKKLGVAYFSSAGNFGNKSHEEVFNPQPVPAGLPDTARAHGFGGTTDIYQRIRLVPGSYTIVLQWDDDIYSIGGSATGTLTDLDIYLVDLSGNLICGYNRVSTYGDPVEILAFTVNNSVSEVFANLLITKANPSGPIPRFKYIIFRGNATIAEYQSGGTTIVGQANAKGAIAVGAVNYFNSPAFGRTLTIAPYSSIGGTSVRADVVEIRQKPDISAPDGVNTSVNMGPDISQDADPFSNFFGTSAAAPHAAATAALLINGKKRFTGTTPSPDSLKALLQRTALPFGTSNASGAGFIQADAAMREFAMPSPDLISLEYPSTITPSTPPTSSFTLITHGKYLTNTTEIIFRDSTLETTFINDSTLSATLPAFTGNPPILVYTPPIANGDGGYSDTIYFFDIAKSVVTIKANDTTKKYGESLPAFTSTILVDGQTLAQKNLTLADLGLQNLTYRTNADSLSNIGNQYFIKPVRKFNTTNPTDIGLLERYTYDTLQGILTIQKLPVTVKPADQTITYGDNLQPITFTYQVDPNAHIANMPVVQNVIKSSHEMFLASGYVAVFNNSPAFSNAGYPVTISNGVYPVTISNGGLPVTISNGNYVPIINPESVTVTNGLAYYTPYNLTSDFVDSLSFLVSDLSLQHARTLNNTMKVVDVSQETLLRFFIDQKQTSLSNAVLGSTAKGIIGAKPLINQQNITVSNAMLPITISNGVYPVTISNGLLPVTISNETAFSLSNGLLPVTISNGVYPVTISNGGFPVTISNGAFPVTISNSLLDPKNNIGIIVDSSDVTQGQIGLVQSINAVTGLTSGTHYIIPAVLMNDNLDIRYAVGNLRINKATLTIKADNKSRQYLEQNPPLTATFSGFKFGETPETSDTSGVVSITTTAAPTSPVGVYPITVSQGTLTSYNYTFNYVPGNLTVTTNSCIVTHDPNSSFNSTPKPDAPTTLWLNVEVKVSGQLANLGDSLVFKNGYFTLNNVDCNPAVTDLSIPNGKIIVTNTSTPVTRFDKAANTWITEIPVNFASTSDIFITGTAVISSKGFTKKSGANSVVKGSFYSNTSVTDQWTFSMACYRPTFTNDSIAAAGGVYSTNGTYKAGTPVSRISGLVSGGSGGGGNNYTGSSTSYQKFTACPTTTGFVTQIEARQENILTETTTGALMQLIPNPTVGKVRINWTSNISGNTNISILNANGISISEFSNGSSEKGKAYVKDLDVSRLSAGMYFIRVQTGQYYEIRKLIIVR